MQITDAIQTRRVAAYRAAVKTLPEAEQDILRCWKDCLAIRLCDGDKRLNIMDAGVRAEAVIAEILWRSG